MKLIRYFIIINNYNNNKNIGLAEKELWLLQIEGVTIFFNRMHVSELIKKNCFRNIFRLKLTDVFVHQMQLIK